MADQKWPAHVPKPKNDADRRCAGPLFQNWRLPIDRFERTRNNVVVFATGRDVCRSQRSLRSPGLVWSCRKSPATAARLVRIARSICSGAGSENAAIRERRSEEHTSELQSHSDLV